MATRKTTKAPWKYSDEIREAAVRKMLAPNAPPVLTLSRELQISDATLHNWKKIAIAAKREEANAEREIKWAEKVNARPSAAREDSSEVERLRKELREAQELVRKMSLRLLEDHDVI